MDVILSNMENKNKNNSGILKNTTANMNPYVFLPSYMWVETRRQIKEHHYKIIVDECCQRFSNIKQQEKVKHKSDGQIKSKPFQLQAIWNIKVSPKCKSHTLVDLRSNVEKEKDDFVVYINNIKFLCDLSTLQENLKFFNDNNLSSLRNVWLPSTKITPEGFAYLYFCIKQSTTTIESDKVLKVYFAARYLRCHPLLIQFWHYLYLFMDYKEETAFNLYLEAEKYGSYSQEIWSSMLSRIRKYFLMIITTEHFLNFDVNIVYQLLKSRYIAVHSEIQVFMSAIYWLLHDWNKRKDHLQHLISTVHFNLMTPNELLYLRRRAIIQLNLRNILGNKSLQKLIDNGLYRISFLYEKNKTLTTVEERNWIDDKEFNNKFYEKLPDYVSYQAFLQYLRKLKKSNKIWTTFTINKSINPNSRIISSFS